MRIRINGGLTTKHHHNTIFGEQKTKYKTIQNPKKITCYSCNKPLHFEKEKKALEKARAKHFKNISKVLNKLQNNMPSRWEWPDLDELRYEEKKEEIVKFNLDEIEREKFYTTELLDEEIIFRITKEGIFELYTVEGA